MSKFFKRSIVTVLLVFAISSVIYLFPEWLFCLVVTLFVGVGQFEFFKMTENRDIFVYKYLGTAIGAMIPLVIYAGNLFPEMKNLEPLLIVSACLFVFVLQITRKDNMRDHLVSMSVMMFSLFYIAWFFSFFVRLRLLVNGANLVAFLILVTKITDMGAYVIGSRFGRTELLPRISPKKTIEGTLGGIFVSLIVGVPFGRYLTGFSYLHLFPLVLLLSTLGQVGDLAESLIKRDCSTKDSGPCFSEIGGVMDLIDSLLFTAPAFYFYVKTF